jgi:beta-phosphoglucomutase family hydrolase
MPIKGLIFDLDGVLVDTVPAHFAAWQRMFEEYGYAFGRKEYRDLVDGRPRFDGARAVMTSHSDPEVREAANKKNGYYVEMIERGEFNVFDTAVTLVRQCQAKGYSLAAASSSANVRTVLEKAGLLDAFPVVVGGDDIEHGKPAPDIFLTAAEGLGLAVEECVVIEDSSSGVRAAKNGGFYCVGLLHDDHVDELAGADQVVSSLADLDIKQIESSMQAPPAIR